MSGQKYKIGMQTKIIFFLKRYMGGPQHRLDRFTLEFIYISRAIPDTSGVIPDTSGVFPDISGKLVALTSIHPNPITT